MNRAMKYAWLILTGLVFTPHVVSSIRFERSGRLDIDPPRICSGDEPHYLIQVNSLLHDGDIDVANNYAAAAFGAADAGERFRSVALSHHVNWYIDGRLVHWDQVFFPNGTRRPRAKELRVPKEEYSQH